ncbi:MAG: L-threonylcarbamoyladenylate synthase [Methanobacteriota archaeon]
MIKILSIDGKSPAVDAIAEAAATIREGGLVIYPTETVYGLGADATSDEAVAKVFVAKSRPIESPLPVVVSSIEMARYIMEMNRPAEALFGRFMPGPLTVVGKLKPESISQLITGGSGKVGVRIPDNRVSLKLVEFVGGPITATSANLSGGPAPTTAKEAIEQLGSKVDLALDSGICRVGKPSTVVDISSGAPIIIRGGPISGSELEKFLNELKT